ncbi:hypothetical protein MRB53_013640 [Persea americana]|uniref:Uncharacterized protein n=1 Tax=Persea americana TaxID=3435 RepID=A0ACC2K8K3_PERAE|nr:hypothetical protein MRB53_013640 [Persea americana]
MTTVKAISQQLDSLAPYEFVWMSYTKFGNNFTKHVTDDDCRLFSSQSDDEVKEESGPKRTKKAAIKGDKRK